MITQYETVDEVIDALGGTRAVARLLLGKEAAVSNWRAAGHFPSNTYLAIQRELAKIGATAPDFLWRMKMAVA